MATARDIADHIASAAVYLIEGGHTEVGEALQLVVTGVDNLPSAMGATPNWRTHAKARHQRELLITILTAVPATSRRAAARTVHDRLVAYASTRWPADRDAGRRPSGMQGWLFDYLKADGPISVERLRKLLPDTWGMNPQDSTHDAA